ncbi:MAG TPA: alpha-D-ribose 1-methylphosphonate 5-triphosphate diphosphatase, partial [Geminicoccaceae bacterium]|nr:alpha-D-ribose 1-methylphosphonate 5-triphosphate diphosphatase [Geminicoccaceae bacterium]
MLEAAAPEARETAAPCILTNARLVLPNEVVRGTLVARRGVIAEIDDAVSRVPAALDLADDLLIPGLVDLHTDNLERHYLPRSGVEWDAVAAAISHDLQIAGAGITTVYDSLTLGSASGWDTRPETVEPIVQGLRTAISHDMLRVQHLLHMRCEVTHPEIVPTFEAYAEDPLVRFMSLMDHAPGDRQSPDMDDYRRRYLRIFQGDEAALERHIKELLHGSRVLGPDNRRRLARIAAERGLPLASHDDARREHIEEIVTLGVTVTEFPTTLEAADAAHDAGVKVLMGAPNLIRGRSHSGNVAAGLLAARDCLDILSSDYIPASLLLGAFRLTQQDFGWSLPRALASVTSVPAAAAGLDD